MILALILTILALLACGCQKRVMWSPAAAQETYSVNPPQAVFAPEIQGSDASTSTTGQPWYASRNNDRLSHRSGAATQSSTGYVIDIYDRQYHHDGNVRNHYQRTTRSREFGVYNR